MSPNVWCIVLGSGDGTRLRGVTTLPDGTCVPKQFCAFGRASTLMTLTLRRARRLTAETRIVPVLAESHRPWWAQEVADLEPENVVVQPRNCGTSSGLLLPVLHVFARDPSAVIAVLPSDHHFDDEVEVRGAIHEATRLASSLPSAVILLGMTAESPQTDLGWVVPCLPGDDGSSRIHDFVEKPDSDRASELLDMGALWSTFMMVGRAQAFLDLYHAAAPALFRAFLSAAESGQLVHGGEPAPALRHLQERLMPSDFSRDVLQRIEARELLRVTRVPPCGWSDLGTPERLSAWMKQEGAGAGAFQ